MDFKTKRFFIIGEEWVYYKIYCGSYSADRILINEIVIIADVLFEKKLIDEWFFIRYKDPNNHLRIRFHLTNLDAFQEVIKFINLYLAKLIKDQVVNDFFLANYKRELERYGGSTIVEAEKLFYHNSKKVVELISCTTPEYDEIARIFSSLQMIKDLLKYFEIPIDICLEFVQHVSMKFKSEHNVKKENTNNLSRVYLKYKTDILSFLDNEQDPEYLDGLSEIIKINHEEIKTIKTILSKSDQNQNINSLDLITSFIHMNINRTFRSKQKEYELLCYDFMSRYYKYVIHKKQ
ncbi:thiopeptide-type bacteriocin biosynthesis protein [Flavobacterium panici]|uniref:thiopeptide-type bacteriocin biosynthesis protein n=1 Tax=Flavobacterium panici TaxID=2654843 RepID=UPI003611D6D6